MVRKRVEQECCVLGVCQVMSMGHPQFTPDTTRAQEQVTQVQRPYTCNRSHMSQVSQVTQVQRCQRCQRCHMYHTQVTQLLATQRSIGRKALGSFPPHVAVPSQTMSIDADPIYTLRGNVYRSRVWMAYGLRGRGWAMASTRTDSARDYRSGACLSVYMYMYLYIHVLYMCINTSDI
jgi:hypothetical protein